MRIVKVKPIRGTARAKCPECSEAFIYPLSDRELIFDEYGRFKREEDGYVYKRYHRCKAQSTLERFK